MKPRCGCPERAHDLHRYECRFAGVEAGVMTRVPNKPKTPLRSFRIPDDIYEAAQKKAAEKGETVSDVVRRALERYGKR